jgi:hypothetical protein
MILLTFFFAFYLFTFAFLLLSYTQRITFAQHYSRFPISEPSMKYRKPFHNWLLIEGGKNYVFVSIRR